MKIDKSINHLQQASASEAVTRQNQAKAGENSTPSKMAETAPPPEGVSVSLGASSQLRSMEAGPSGPATIDSKKVAEIKQAISEGRFQINTAAIADRLINDVEDLLNASQS